METVSLHLNCISIAFISNVGNTSGKNITISTIKARIIFKLLVLPFTSFNTYDSISIIVAMFKTCNI